MHNLTPAECKSVKIIITTRCATASTTGEFYVKTRRFQLAPAVKKSNPLG